ncbi:MAG: response regulator [Pseudomonadota bacterium]
MDTSIKVLMVDDEERFRETTKKILEHEGFQVFLAGSGPEALAKLSENPDVVVLDIKMPGMDGHETLEKIKAQAPDLPVIMLTGHGARPSAQKALTKGAFEYLTKPCDIALLTSKIREAYAHVRERGAASYIPSPTTG